jgi:hypothetical protein
MTIRWGRILGLAIALEVALFATLLPLQPLLSQRTWFVAIGIFCAVFGYIAGRLAARGLASGAVLHGVLVGVVATAIYLALNVFGPGGLGAAVTLYGAPLFVFFNALRIVGSAAGAFHAAPRSA